MGGPRPQIELDPDALGPDIAGSYSVAGIEVTQAVQDMDHSVPLIAGKVAVIRLYLDRPDATVVTVRGEIEISGDLGTMTVPSLDTLDLDPAANGDLAGRRTSLVTSLNFMLPKEVNVAGSWAARVTRIVTADTETQLTDANPGATRQFELIEAPPLRVRVVSFRHQGGNPVRTFEPGARDYELVASWLRRAFPVSDVVISRITTDAWRAWPFRATDINAQLTAMRSLDIASGGDPLTHYVGIVSDGGGRTFMRGRASVIPSAADPSAVASAPVGAGAYPWDSDGSYGDWYAAHELAHTFGRRHVGTLCGDDPADPEYPFPQGVLSEADEAFVGIDVGDTALDGVPMRIYRGTSSHDLMCYCEFIWMSAYTYRGIHQRISDEAAEVDFAGPPMIAVALEDAMLEQTKWFNVIGTVDFTDRRGTIDQIVPLTAPQTPGAEPSPLTVALFDADDELIEVQPARVKIDSCRDPDEHDEGVVDTFVAASDRIARIELRIDDQPVASYSAAPPADPGFAGPPIALDAVTNARFNVQISPDDGATWQTVAVNVADPEAHTVNRSDFPGARSLRRRILATGGFRTWSVGEDTI